MRLSGLLNKTRERLSRNDLTPKNLMRYGVVSVLMLAGCQANVERQRLVLDTSIFPDNVLKYEEQPTSKLERQVQEIKASHEGRIMASVYLRAPSNYVWVRKVEELDADDLKNWGNFKNEDIKLGAYNYLKTSIAEIQYRKFEWKNRECMFFGRSFGASAMDDTRRATQKIIGYFCEKKGGPLRDFVIADLLNGFSLIRTAQPIALQTRSPQAAATTRQVAISSPSRQPAQLLLSGKWEGVSDDITGFFTTDSSKNKGQLRVIIDHENKINSICTGQWLWAKGKYNSIPLPQGTWSVACEDGLTASGTYLSSEPNVGTVEGEDNQGRAILLEFTS